MSNRPKRLLLNADDFGATAAHNEAVVLAHEAGAINSASLMVGQEGTQEAVRLAQAHPALSVGLHLTLTNAVPITPPEEIPLLVNAAGRLCDDDSALWRAALSYAGRSQIDCEVAAQFRAYAATGLPCAHVNTHQHTHLLPHVAVSMTKHARVAGVTQSRVPLTNRHGPSRVPRVVRLGVIEAMLRVGGIPTVSHAVCHPWDCTIVIQALQNLPSGLPELYFHPTTHAADFIGNDLPVLLDQDVIRAIRRASNATDTTPSLTTAVGVNPDVVDV
jgi:predicted glycoside hydrolase/deacetylase ChbG (UPF0249 family)